MHRKLHRPRPSSPHSTPRTVVGYIRVSTQDQATRGASLETQAAKIRKWAENHGLTLAETYEDRGVSATKSDRPGLLAALDRVCRDKGVLVVYSLSRIARSVGDAERIAGQLEKTGADLVSLSEEINTTSATGKFLFRIIASVAALERDLVGERTSAALDHLRDQSRIYGEVPYGFSRDGGDLVPDPEHQVTLGLMRDLRRQGISYRAIADELNRQLRPSAKGGKWHAASVRRILARLDTRRAS